MKILENINISQARQLLDDKKISSVDLSKFFLDRISRFDQKINSCVNIERDEVLRQAQSADERLARGERGDLLGIPYLLADNILTKDIKSSASSKALFDYYPPYDATVYQSLKSQGAVLLAKTNLNELALGPGSKDSTFGSSKNPWDLDKESEGAVAALAANFAIFALTVDSNSSLTYSASGTALFAARPSYGQISRFGIINSSSSLGGVGVLAKNVSDLSLVLENIIGPDAFDLSLSSEKIKLSEKDLVKKLKKMNLALAFDEEVLSDDKSLITKWGDLKKIFEKNKISFTKIDLPYQEYFSSTQRIIFSAELSSNLARLDGIRYGFSLLHKPKGRSAAGLQELYLLNRSESFSSALKKEILLGTYFLDSGQFDSYYRPAMEMREKIKESFSQLFDEFSFILGLSLNSYNSQFGGEQEIGFDNLPLAASLAGLAIISLPLGLYRGLPLSLEIIAPAQRENLLFNLAYNLEKEGGLSSVFPKIS